MKKRNKKPEKKNDIMKSAPKTQSDPGYLAYLKEYLESLGGKEKDINDTVHSVYCCYIAQEMLTQFELIEGNLKWIMAQNGGDADAIKKQMNQMLYYYYDFEHEMMQGFQDIKALLYNIYTVFPRIPRMFDDYLIHLMGNGFYVFEFAPFRIKNGSCDEFQTMMGALKQNGMPLITATADPEHNQRFSNHVLHFITMDDMQNDNTDNEQFKEIKTHFNNLMEYCVLNGLMDSYQNYIDKKGN
jgi:hypothetical protein